MSISPETLREFPLRIGLMGAGSILITLGIDLWIQGQPFQQPANFGLSAAAWAAGMLCFILGLMSHPPRHLAWSILFAALAAQVGNAYLQQINFTPLTSSHTDNEMIAEYSAQVLRDGQNPYAWDFSDMLRVFRDAGKYYTPLLDGSYQHRLTYPILPTLTLLALDFVGLGQVRTIGLAFHLLLFVLLFISAPERLRPAILLPVYLFRGFNYFTLGGVQDIVWSALLVAMILAWKRPGWRAVLFGLACAYRQQPWLAAPFIAIQLWNEPGSRADRRHRLLQFFGVSIGVFILINLPFIVWDPRAWWLGALEPSYARFNVVSQGLGALTQFGLAPFPREFYTALQVVAYAILLFVHWRHPRAVGQAYWIFPGVFFWLYYRGLANYWIYWIPPLLMGLSRQLKDLYRPAVSSWPAPDARRTVAFALALLVPNLVWGTVLLARPPALEVQRSVALQTLYGQWVNRLYVRVTNTSTKSLLPRFAVQHDPGVQAMPWTIESGPEQLSSGQSGDYLISTQSTAKAFPISAGGQVVVTDAGGDYSLRSVTTIPADLSFQDPDAIVNPNFTYWPAGGPVPDGWTWQVEGERPAYARMQLAYGRPALVVRVEGGKADEATTLARVSQTITWPDAFAVWAHPAASAARPPESAYGIELDDGRHRLWVLFGDSDDTGWLRSNLAYMYLRAAPGEWTRVEIRPAELFARLGWQLPPYSLRQAAGLEYSARQVKLSLLVASGQAAQVVGVFGPLELLAPAKTPDTYVSEALAHPELYYANLGDEYRRQRNFDLAVETYQRGLTFKADSPENFFGLGEAYFWLAKYAEAEAAFQRSIALEYKIAESYRGLGWSAYSMNDLDAAASAFRQALANDPALADAYNGLGRVWQRQGNCSEAVRYFRKALELDPEFLEPRQGLAECGAASLTAGE